MSPFPNTRSKRRTVYTLLLVWFFALGSGWANACLLQERETHLHGPLADASSTVHASRVSPGHVGVDSDHAENSGSAKSACLKVCGDDSQTSHWIATLTFSYSNESMSAADRQVNPLGFLVSDFKADAEAIP